MSKKKWACIAILALDMLENDEENESREELSSKKIKRVRSVWTKNWLLHRQTEGFCAKLMLELRSNEPELYQGFVRMSADQFDHLLSLVGPRIQKADTNMRSCISALDRLMLTLRFLATGDNFRSMQYLFRIPVNTISTIIPEVLDAIYEALVVDYLKIPRSENDWRAVAEEFNQRWQFPNCIGAVDGKHVVMVAPPNAGSVFYNYKGTHSIVLMGIADAEYRLLYVDVGLNGRHSDGGVFNRCSFEKALTSNQLCLPPPKALPGREMPVPFVLVADDAFAMRPNLLKPYAQRGLTMVQRVYNYRLSRARRIIENVFGIMSARFRVLRKPIHLDAEKTTKVTLACCVLHNYLITTNKAKYTPSSSFDQYDDNGNLISPGEWRANVQSSTMYPLQSLQSREDFPDVKKLQKEFTNYFTEEGDVEWQYGHI